MIASDIIYRVLKSLGEKGVRRLDKTAKNIAELVKSKAELGDRIEVKIEEIEEEMKARTINEGIKVFSRKHPEYGEELKKIIEETRMKRNNYQSAFSLENFIRNEETFL